MSNYRILLLDYEPRSIALAKVPLEAAGFQVEVATDGLAGIEAFNRLHPDLVLIEAMLPKKHGFEVCQEIKRTPEGKRTPIVITTGVYRGRKYRSQALHIHGCDEYLEKPFASDLLVSLCTQFLTGGAPAASTEPADPVSAPASEAPSAIADVADAVAATTGTPHSFAASIIADLTEDEIIARLDALLPGDSAPCAIAPAEAAGPQDAPAEAQPAEASQLESVAASLEDLLEPLPSEAVDDEPVEAEPRPAADFDPAATPHYDPEIGAKAPVPLETAQTGAPEQPEPSSFEAVGTFETWPSIQSDVEDALIESVLDERLTESRDETSKSEKQQIVPFDVSRSRKRRRARGTFSAGSGSGAAAADAVAVTESVPPEAAEHEVATPAAVAGSSPEVRLEPPVRVARPTPADAPAVAPRKISWWMWAAAVVAAGAAFYLVFKPAAGRKAMPPSVVASRGPDAVWVEPSAPAPVEPSRGEEATGGAVHRAGRVTSAPTPRGGMPDEASPAPPRSPAETAPKTASAAENAKPATLPVTKAPRAEAETANRSTEQTPETARKAWELVPTTTPASPTTTAAENATPQAVGTEPIPETGKAEAEEPRETMIAPPPTLEPVLPAPPSPATERGALVPIEAVDTPPVPMSRPAPTYTSRARMLRQHGSVLLSLLVDENGKVAEIKLIQGISASDLNESARQAAGKWTYHPATKDGVPVKVWKPEKINFVL